MQIINPLEYPNWDEVLLTNGDYSFFHTSAWARVLHETYNFKPVYFTSIENGKLSALIPVMEVNSFLTGRRGVSLPFTDYCQPIVTDKAFFQRTVDEVIKYGKKAGWKYIEFRGGGGYFHGAAPSSCYVEHSLGLGKSEEQIFSSFRDSTKRNIKKALKKSVTVTVSRESKSVKDFFRLNCMTRKNHGLPPQPYSFFKGIHKHIISQNKGFVASAFHNGECIAAAVYFHFGDRAIYKYGASDNSYQSLRPNNLVMWEAIKCCAGNGLKNFSFGRTELENKGLLQFKRGWGTNERVLNYFRFDLKKEVFVKDHGKLKTSYAFFKRVPAPLSTLAGSLLYRHVG